VFSIVFNSIGKKLSMSWAFFKNLDKKFTLNRIHLLNLQKNVLNHDGVLFGFLPFFLAVLLFEKNAVKFWLNVDYSKSHAFY
jgi:hypothetical protein